MVKLSELETMTPAQNAGKSRAAHVSWSSLEKRRAEHERSWKVKSANTKNRNAGPTAI